MSSENRESGMISVSIPIIVCDFCCFGSQYIKCNKIKIIVYNIIFTTKYKKLHSRIFLLDCLLPTRAEATMSGDIELLVQGLKELQAAKYDTRADILASCHQTGRVLDLIYDLGSDKTEISDENKAIIGPLLESSIKSIEIDIKSTALKYRRRLDTEALRKRSALQFLIDDFGDFPTKTQDKKFSEYFSDINELIEILDDLISKWKGREDPDDPSSDRDEADDLPDSHTWWKD